MTMRKLFAAGMLAVCCGAMAQSEISEYQPGVTAEGAVYFLPKTVMRVVVRLEKTTYTPGEFCKYAERYLRLNDVGQEPSVAYRVTDISMSTYGEADKRKAYAVKYDTKSVAANVKLADDGTLLAINSDAKVAEEPAAFVPAPRKKAENPKSYLSADILSSGSTAKMAELTAQEIYDIRDSKNQLNRGEADFMPKDGEQLKIMLANLDKQDQALTQMFVGTEVKDTLEEVFFVCPEAEVKKQVLFRLSNKLGVVDDDDLSGTPYYFSVEDMHTVPAVTEEETAKTKKKKTEYGIYVNVPSKIRLTISKGNKTIKKFETSAGQFGHVELLSGELFNKRATTYLTLNPSTGAIDKFNAEMPK